MRLALKGFYNSGAVFWKKLHRHHQLQKTPGCAKTNQPLSKIFGSQMLLFENDCQHDPGMILFPHGTTLTLIITGISPLCYSKLLIYQRQIINIVLGGLARLHKYFTFLESIVFVGPCEVPH